MYKMSHIAVGMIGIPLAVGISMGLAAKVSIEYVVGLALGALAAVTIPLILIGHSYDGKGPVVVNKQPSEAVSSRGFHMEVDETRGSMEKT